MAEKIDDTRLCNIVKDLVSDAEKYRDERSIDREKAMAFFDGDAKDLAQYIPYDEGRSKVVSRDVRAAVRKVLPSVLRTILGHDEIVEFTPVGEGDEEGAEQATDYINYVVLPECNGRQSIEDAINDALRLRNGIIKWWQEEKIEVRVSRHSGLDEIAFAQLVAEDDVEVMEHTERQEAVEVPDPETGQMASQPIPVHDVKIKRRITKKLPRLAAIAPEKFLVHPDAIRLVDSPIVGEEERLRRSDLVAMGYDRALVDTMPAAGTGTNEQDAEEDQRRRDSNVVGTDENANSHAMQEVDYWDLLVRVDLDNDGIAELRRIVYAGAIKPEFMLENVEWDELNYADIVSERRPHQWEGNSVTDEAMDIQTINTVLTRQTMDNLYWQNNLQPIVQEGQIVDLDAVNNPSFGKPIRVTQGVDVRAAVGYNVVPMVADKSFAMIEFWKNELTDRTGISDASSGMAPDALQNMTAKASAMIEQAGIGQTEMMVKCIAESLKPVFRGLLALVIQHQDIPRTVRLRKKWVTFDPRQWNADMDAIVNIGLGAGTRERDMMVMKQVVGLQKDILASMGPTVGQQFVSVDNLYNGIAKLVEASGLKSVGLYFTKPDPEAVQQAMQAQSQQPSPEQIKAETALAIEDKRTEREIAKIQANVTAKREEYTIKAQADVSKEQAQMDADLVTTLQQIEAEANARMEEAVLKARADNADRQVQREQMAVDVQMNREEIASRERIAAASHEASIQQAKAASIGKAFEKNDKAAEKAK
jgi:hypothetical protein